MTGVLYYKTDAGDLVQIGGGVPVVASAYIGEIRLFASASAVPAKWLVCNNAAVSRTTYAGLFAAIGTQWGAGDGSATFNVPDLIDRTIRGGAAAGAKGGTADTVLPSHNHSATSGGRSAAHSHTTDISHLHSIANGDNNSGLGARGAYVVGGSWGASADSGASGGWWDYAPTNWQDSAYTNRGSGTESADHSHGITVNANGVSATGQNWPPYGTVVPAIYAGA